MSLRFLMAGGGTGGHVVPAIAVARELKAMGHEAIFVGTRTGMEAKIVPEAGFAIEWIEAGGLNRVGPAQMLKSLSVLPMSVIAVLALIRRLRPSAVFSMGGFVAGPVMLAAALRGLPITLMEPNAIAGMTARHMAPLLSRVLLSFEEAAKYFPPSRVEITGLPVRPEFFALPTKPFGSPLHVLITGGSRGSKKLNETLRESWPLWRSLSMPVRLIHLTGPSMFVQLQHEFATTGLDGEVVAFSHQMPQLFAEADLIVCRSGAGAVSELAAAGKPSILVPFPFAADDHQRRNAEALRNAGAARLITDAELTADLLVRTVRELASATTLTAMGQAARRFARPGAAQRAAEILIATVRSQGARS